MRRGLGRDDDRGIVERVLAEQAFLGLLELVLRLHDQEEIVARLRDHAIGDGARDDDVIAGLEIERAEIGFDHAVAAMDEVQLVAIGIAEVERHGLRAARDGQADVVVAEERHGHAFGVGEVGGLQAVEIEAMRAQLAFEADPAGGRMRVVEMRGFAVEAFAAVLLFVGALGAGRRGPGWRFCLF